MNKFKTFILALFLSLSMSAPAYADTDTSTIEDYLLNIVETLDSYIGVDVDYIYGFSYQLVTMLSVNQGYSSYIASKHNWSGGFSSGSFYFPRMSYYTYEYKDESIIATKNTAYCTYPYFIEKSINGYNTYLLASAKQFFNWFYPLKESEPVYWQVWDTDTGQAENVNLATVGYYITWYLGQMYQMNTYDVESNGLTEKVQDFADSVKEFDSNTTSLFETAKDNFSSFNPKFESTSTFMSTLRKISQYLQKCFVALGKFNIPITISLILAICMQFIGFYKFKRG